MITGVLQYHLTSHVPYNFVQLLHYFVIRGKQVFFHLQCISNSRATVASHRVDPAGCGQSQNIDRSLSNFLAGAQCDAEMGHGLSESGHGSTNGLLALLTARSAGVDTALQTSNDSC